MVKNRIGDFVSKKEGEKMDRIKHIDLIKSLEVAGDGILVADEVQTVTFVNHKACAILEKEKKLIIGKALDQVFDIVSRRGHESLIYL